MKLKFLGTGAADWHGPDERGEFRRFTSTLLDGRLLIDVTQTVFDQIPDQANITDVFYTHSHTDHFSLEALRALAPCRAYAHESWAEELEGEGIVAVPLKVGRPVQAAGFTVTPMPANHATGRENETALHYLLEKDGKTLLYATDGGWLMNMEYRILGDRMLDAIVFDATVGDGFDGGIRIFGHNSIDMIRMMLKTLARTGRMREGAPIYLTHLARLLHDRQEVLERQTEKPMIVCFDGLEAEI